MSALQHCGRFCRQCRIVRFRYSTRTSGQLPGLASHVGYCCSRSVACRIARAGERPITPLSGKVLLFVVFARLGLSCLIRDRSPFRAVPFREFDEPVHGVLS